MENENSIPVEVAYAKPEVQVILSLDVPAGTTVKQAIEKSGILQQFSEIDLANNAVGVFGKIASLDDVLTQKDRVEIYRALIADPKESRRKRAEKKERVKA